LAQRKADSESLQAELNDLRSKLQEARIARDQAAELADQTAVRFSKIKQQLAACERRAHLATALKQAFESAQQVRKQYAEAPPNKLK